MFPVAQKKLQKLKLKTFELLFCHDFCSMQKILYLKPDSLYYLYKWHDNKSEATSKEEFLLDSFLGQYFPNIYFK